tara:strand:- start:1458 stop:2507 length:1050 start_codon:yes stop_codon:yes gene_type:complete
MGNHLLENGFSLLFGAYFFRDEQIYNKGYSILKVELEEQILDDGAHFELSPMYHQIILHRILDSINLIRLNPWKDDTLLNLLIEKAKLMLSWLKNVAYKDGSIPMVNDSAYNITFSSKDLLDYAQKLNIEFNTINLGASGYRKINNEAYELFLDVGNIGPDYQPGHAHSDTFSFELMSKGRPFIVDTGTSTYEKNTIRQLERDTSSHNTVMINDKNQSEVWGGFRVAKRAKILSLKEGKNYIEASHNGYKIDGYIHNRCFSWSDNIIVIKDEISKKTDFKAKAFFHFDSEVTLKIKGDRVYVNDLKIEFSGAKSLHVEEYNLANGFNCTVKAQKIIAIFDNVLETQIFI